MPDRGALPPDDFRRGCPTSAHQPSCAISTAESWESWGPISPLKSSPPVGAGVLFGPVGKRSFGGNRGTDYNAGIPNKAAYYREANEQMLVCALLEDVAVLKNLEGVSRCRY